MFLFCIQLKGGGVFMSRVKSIFYNRIPSPTTTNREGFPAYERSLEEQYLQVLLCNTLGNTFYVSSEQLMQETEQIHDAILAADPEFAAKAFVFARNEGFMRLQPTWGLAKLAGVRPDLFEQVFDRVILIPSDLQDFFTILKSMGRGQGGRTIKRTVSRWLNEKLSEYWVIKYNGRGRGFSLGDIIRTVHPKPASEKLSALFKYAVHGEYDAEMLPQVAALETLKRAQTPEERARLIMEGRLPHEVVTGVGGLDKECWRAIVPQLPFMALLRNLNTLARHGVLDEFKDYITAKLTDIDALGKSKVFPFQFLKAFQQVETPWVKDVLRQAVEITVNNIPEIPGKTAIFLDVSASMQGDYLLIGSVFAIALYKRAGGNAIFWTFDTEVYEQQPSLIDSVLSQAEKIKARGGTNTGAPVRRLTTKRLHVDNIIIVTDEQQNTGSPFYSALADYRRRVNPTTRAFIIDVSPYRSAMVPPSDLLTYYIYGWSDQVLRYIPAVIHGFGGMVERVRSVQIDRNAETVIDSLVDRGANKMHQNFHI
jgi:60 kDa SS-A/Ro ribonucleoprotein